MNALRGEIRLLVDLVAAPRLAVATIASRAPLFAPLAALAVLQAAVMAAQSVLLQPALLADPMLADLPGDTHAALVRYWLARAAVVLLWPVGCALRAAALATVLNCAGVILGAPLAWRPLLSLALHLDLVFWLENLAVTLLLSANRPLELDSLRTLRLHAGLDLLWHPASQFAAALLESANGFTVWWAVLLTLGLVHCLRLPRPRAMAIAAATWSALVALRCLFSLR